MITETEATIMEHVCPLDICYVFLARNFVGFLTMEMGVAQWGLFLDFGVLLGLFLCSLILPWYEDFYLVFLYYVQLILLGGLLFPEWKQRSRGSGGERLA